MDFGLTEEQVMLRGMARQFAASSIEPGTYPELSNASFQSIIFFPPCLPRQHRAWKPSQRPKLLQA